MLHTIILHVYRQPGQGGSADNEVRDLRAELLKAEATHFAKKNGGSAPEDNESPEISSSMPKRQLETSTGDDVEENEESEAKRRRLILEEAKDIDADSDGGSSESSDSSDEEYGIHIPDWRILII